MFNTRKIKYFPKLRWVDINVEDMADPKWLKRRRKKSNIR